MEACTAVQEAIGFALIVHYEFGDADRITLYARRCADERNREAGIGRECIDKPNAIVLLDIHADGITRLSLAPKDEPMMAAIIEGTAIFQLIRPSFINLTVETVVPQALDSLLVAMAV